MLILWPLVTTAQVEDRITYTIDSYHNRGCIGGIGTCPGTTIVGSTEKTTASVAKVGQNKLQLSLDKEGFSSKEWEELFGSKTFPVDESSRVDAELIRSLAIDPRFNTIKKGLYPVAVFEDKAIVVFELIERK